MRSPRTALLTWGVCGCLLFLAGKACLRLSLWLVPLPTATLERDYSTVSLDPAGNLLRIALSRRGTYRIRLPLEEIAVPVKEGALLYEDRYFYWHPGVNPVAIARSIVTNLRAHRVVMGASTLTMQIAKLMEPKRRTFKGKLWEVFRALQLESRYSKKDLLAIYLNLVPMGGNIEGVGAASYLYFGKPARALSLGESALLIGLPRSPNRYRPDRHPEAAKEQKLKIMERIRPDMKLGPETLAFNRDRAVPTQRFANPFACPHLVLRTHAFGPSFFKHLTVDPRIQTLAEDKLRETVKTLSPEGVFNGAVLIIDNHTMRVVAYVGSPDFGDHLHGGQLNGARLERSPGSLLKPFLYAAAVEKGMLTPRKAVYDIDRNYDGYVPANFDRKFTGPVPAEEALARSLNIPAVNLEYELGKDGLSALIRHAGLLDEARAKRVPGLSLVLGAYPLSLEELVRLYAVFANKGQLRDLIFFQEDLARPNRGVSLLKPETCFIISEMLSKLERPDLPQSWEFTSSRSRVAFKTGTSFGLRDAWTVAFNPDYTVGVWLGNVDAKGSSALIGIKAAAPLAVSMFNDLTRYQDSWFRVPPGVKQRAVCAVSGEPAGPFCAATRSDYYIPGVSAEGLCAVHQKITVRRSDGVQVCKACMNGRRRDYREKIVEVWPPDVASYLRKHGNDRVILPLHNPECHAVRADAVLKVRSPLPGGFYAMTEALNHKEQKIPLMAQSQSGAETVYWYVDDVLVGHGTPDQILYVDPKPGLHHARVMDARGHFDGVEFHVRRQF